MKGKKGIELSVNFIVMIIIAIVVLGMGIKLAVDMIKTAPTPPDKTIEQYISAKLATDRLVVYPASAEIKKGKSYSFGIGIKNTISGSDYFLIAYKLDKAYKGANDIDPAKIILKETIFEPRPRIAAGADNNNKLSYFAVTVPFGSASGTYIYNIYVCNDANQPASCDGNSDLYDGTKQIIITVP